LRISTAEQMFLLASKATPMTPTTEEPVDYFLTLSGSSNGDDMPMQSIAALRSGAVPLVCTLSGVSISGNYMDSANVLPAQLV
jgi:hypothetical protein